MKKRIFLRLSFCLLEGVILFACSKDYERLADVGNSISSSFDYNIEGGTYTEWLTEKDLIGL